MFFLWIDNYVGYQITLDYFLKSIMVNFVSQDFVIYPCYYTTANGLNITRKFIEQKKYEFPIRG